MTKNALSWMAVAAVGCLVANAPLMRPQLLTRELSEKLLGDPDVAAEHHGDRGRDNREARPADSERGPLAYEEEQYALRAYPAAEIPFQATLNAQAAFASVKGRGAGNKAGVWTLYGPSTATMPSTLSFYGGGPNARYVTSGRITALAIGPTCTTNDCVVLLGAAGGGVWKSDRALAGNPGWRYVSEEVPSSAVGVIERDQTDPTGLYLLPGHRRTERVGRFGGWHRPLQVDRRRRDLDRGRDERQCQLRARRRRRGRRSHQRQRALHGHRARGPRHQLGHWRRHLEPAGGSRLGPLPIASTPAPPGRSRGTAPARSAACTTSRSIRSITPPSTPPLSRWASGARSGTPPSSRSTRRSHRPSTPTARSSTSR